MPHGGLRALSRAWWALAVLALPAAAPAAVAGPVIREVAVTASPGAITGGPDGNVWFTAPPNQVGRVTPAGAVTPFRLPFFANTQGITAGPDGAVWFAGKDATYDPGEPDPFQAMIWRVSPEGAVTGFPVPGPPSGPSGIVAGSDGALWFADDFVEQIGRITMAGGVTLYPLDGPRSFLSSIAAGPDGALWFARQTGSIGRITTDGSITEFPACCNPFDLVAGPDGALWFTDRSDTSIGRITTSGAVTHVPVSNTPTMITTGSDGALWFTETEANQIGRLTTSGELSEFPIPTAASGATDIAGGPDGNVWFAETSAKQIGTVLLRTPPEPPPAAAPAAPPAAPAPAPARDLIAPALQVLRVKQSLADVLRRGLAVRAACDERCTALITVSIPRPLARRLRVPATLRSQSFALAPPRPATLRVRLSARTRNALQRLRRVTFSVQVLAKDAVGNARRPTVVRITVRR